MAHVNLARLLLAGVAGIAGAAGLRQGFGHIQRGRLRVALLQQGAGLRQRLALRGQRRHLAGHQRQRLRGVRGQLGQRLQRGLRLALGGQQAGALHAGAGSAGRARLRLLQQGEFFARLLRGGGLLAQVVRQVVGEVARQIVRQRHLALACQQLLRQRGGARPVMPALANDQLAQRGLLRVSGALQPGPGGFGAVIQARFHEVQRQLVAGALAVVAGQIGARKKVLVHANGAVKFAPAAKEAAQRKVQIAGFGVFLHGFDEGVYGLILLLVEQKVQALEIGPGRLAVFQPPLPPVNARGPPAQRKHEGKAQQNPAQIEFHDASHSWRALPPPAACRLRQAGSMPATPAASPAAKASSTISAMGACQYNPKAKRKTASCWLLSAKANKSRNSAAFSSHLNGLITWGMG